MPAEDEYESEFSTATRLKYRRPEETAGQTRARQVLEPLYYGKHELDEVNQAMTDLEIQLSNAGARCIQEYHRWGDKFWTMEDETARLNGLLKAYWNQVMIVASMRRNFQAESREFQLIAPIQQAWVEQGSPKTGDDAAVWRIETGHYRSITDKIQRTVQAGNQSEWEDMVIIQTNDWKKKNPASVVDFFRQFVTDPSLENWNRLIARSVLYKYDSRFNKAYPRLLSSQEMKLAKGFKLTAMEEVGDANQAGSLYVWISESGQYPTDYIGLTRLLAATKDVEKKWQSINYLLSDEAGDRKMNKDQMLRALAGGLDFLNGLDLPVSEDSEVPENLAEAIEDPASIRERNQAEKRKRKKKTRDNVPEEPQEQPILEMSDDEGEVSSVLTERELVRPFVEMNSVFNRIRRGQGGDQQLTADMAALREIFTKEAKVDNFINTVCQVRGAVQSNNPGRVREIIQEDPSRQGQRGQQPMNIDENDSSRGRPTKTELMDRIETSLQSQGLKITKSRENLPQWQAGDGAPFKARNGPFLSGGRFTYNVVQEQDGAIGATVTVGLDGENMTIDQVWKAVNVKGLAADLVLYAMLDQMGKYRKQVLVALPTIVVTDADNAEFLAPLTNIACWYAKALNFIFGFNPEFLSDTDIKCRDLTSVKENLIGSVPSAMGALDTRIPASAPTGSAYLMGRDAPNLEEIAAMITKTRSVEGCESDAPVEGACERLQESRPERGTKRRAGNE